MTEQTPESAKRFLFPDEATLCALNSAYALLVMWKINSGIEPAADLYAHPYGDRKGGHHENNREDDQQQATDANTSLWILQSWMRRQTQ